MSKKTKKNIWFIDGHWQSNMLCGLDWTRGASPQTSIPQTNELLVDDTKLTFKITKRPHPNPTNSLLPED
jgi:hypothetical protein